MSNIVPLNANNQPPAELADLAARDAGKGVSMKAEDQLMPLIYVLQTNSPQCIKRGSGYIEGAEPGHFYLRGAIQPIRDGIAGIDVVPCAMTRVWMEWAPNREGFVARHNARPGDASPVKVSHEGAERIQLIRSSGNIVADTREYYLLVGGGAYVLPCYGTKHTFARAWQTHFQQYRDERTGAVYPSFARHYRLTTIPTANALGEWFGLKFEDLGWIDTETYEAARALNDVVERGAQRVEVSINEGGAPTAA
jgi:hypothetical protein